MQGAGKTTLCGKLAMLLKKQGKKPLLVAGDIYRPAAINQLQVVGGKAGVPVFEKGTQNPVKTAKQAIDEARSMGYDTVIIDTAGRLHIDDALMQELENIKNEVHPNEILLTVDAMTGQDAVNVAETFNKRLDVTGVILTKLDGDTRGGACLSIKAVTGKPIKFIGVGEKLTDLEPFYPDRMASRILGMGDVLSLIEKAQEAVTEEQAKKLEKKLRDASFTLEDYLDQFSRIALKKMGASLPSWGHDAGHEQAENQGERLRRAQSGKIKGDDPVDDEKGARKAGNHQLFAQKAHRGGQRHDRAGREPAVEAIRADEDADEANQGRQTPAVHAVIRREE